MHKTLLFTLLFTLLLSSLSFAEKSYSFFGMETSYVNYKDVSSPSFGLKYGIQKGMWRSTFNLNYATNGSDNLSSLILQVDKGIFKNATKNSPLKPHAGFSFGVLHNQDTGYGYGVNTGVTYLLNDKIDLDLSYRLMSTTSIDKMNSLNTLTLSLHYFY